MDKADLKRFGWALLVAIGIHIFLFLALLFWAGLALFIIGVHKANPVKAQEIQLSRAEKDRLPTLTFVDVSESQSVVEPPKDTQRYSDRNSIAANPEPNKELNEPKIDGTQENANKTDASSQKKFDQLMPDPPKPKLSPGNMTIAKVDLKKPEEKKRPRTIKEAMLQRGEQAKRDGGIARRGTIAEDVKVMGFGAYDRAFIDAVSDRWYDLLDNMSYDSYRQGKVVVQFVLNYDGRISEMKVVESTVSETLSLLCQKAVLDPAPFDKWPREMRLMVGEDSRRITFTFNYN
jgi:outer membrane biosynthesis protein TonB